MKKLVKKSIKDLSAKAVKNPTAVKGGGWSWKGGQAGGL